MLAENSFHRAPDSGEVAASKSGSSLTQYCPQSWGTRVRLGPLTMSLPGALFAALGLLLTTSQFATAATNADFYVYEGSQSGAGFTSGSTVSVSTGLNELALCINTTSGTAPNVTYTPLCNTAAAPGSGLLDGNLYTAVAFIGTYADSNKNSINLFAVGDLNGNVYLMYPTVNSQGVPQTMAQYGNPYKYECNTIPYTFNDHPCRVIALAKDPNSNTLYISFANTNDSCKVGSLEEFGNSGKEANPAGLVVISINSADGSLAATPSNTYNDYLWQDYGGTNGVCGSGIFDYVSPKLRVYPPNYPGLSGTDYFSTGAVFYSGIIGGNGESDIPVNKGYLCSGIQCQVSYAITLSSENTMSVMTSAEYGVDNRGSTTVPVLYWNQVGAGWVWNKDAQAYFPLITGGTSNTLQSCQLISPVSAAITNSPCQAYVPLGWPPSAGPFVNEMVYLQTPIDPTTNQPFGSPSSVGVLMMSVWSPGYLAYHALDGNEGTSVLFTGNGSNGEIGTNPVSLIPDLNGSVFMVAGAEGLVGFNIFAGGDNLGTTLDDFTYIDITSASSGGSDVGSAVSNGLSIVGTVASVIGLIVALAPNPTTMVLAPGSTTSQLKMTPATPAGFQSLTLEGALGSKPHRGRYTYDEATMKKLGIRPGQLITGLKFAVAKGISSRPKQDIKVQEFHLQLESGGKVGSRPSSSYPQTVLNGSLCIASESYDRIENRGFGPTIWFNRPYQYRGGDLTLSVFGSGSDYTEYPFTLEAATGNGVSGAYVTGLEALQILSRDHPQVDAAPNVIFQKGQRSHGRWGSQCH